MPPKGRRVVPRNEARLPPKDSSSSQAPIGGSRRSIVSVACTECQSRKTRCDGSRPACKSCLKRGRECHYEIEAGLTRKQALRQQNNELQHDVDAFLALYVYLQRSPLSDVHDFIGQIRSGMSVEAAIKIVRETDYHFSAPADFSPLQENNAASGPKLEEDALLPKEGFALSAAGDMDAVVVLRAGTDCYFRCVGTIFPLYNHADVDQMMRELVGKQAVGTLDDRKAAYGELFAIAALGFQYNPQTKAENEIPRDKLYYEKARYLFDHVITTDLLRAIRMCTCFAIYHSVAPSALSIAYADWGVLLASNYEAKYEEPTKPIENENPDELQSRYLKVFKTLATVRKWLSGIMGYAPEPHVVEWLSKPIDIKVHDHNDLLYLIRLESATVTVIKAKILRTIVVSKALTLSNLRRFKEELASWHACLPSWMSMENMANTTAVSNSVTSEQRQATFHMHLFYLSAIMLKGRAILAERSSADAPSYDPDEVRIAVLDSIDAARSSARLLGLLRGENSAVGHSWLTIYQSYLSFLALSFAVTKNLIHDHAVGTWQQDMAMSQNCLDVLRISLFEPNAVAESFLTRLRPIFDMLELYTRSVHQAQQNPFTNPLKGPVSRDHYLFAPHAGQTPLHSLVRDILRMLCHTLDCKSRADSVETLDELPKSAVLAAFIHGDVNISFNSPALDLKKEESG